MNKQLPEAEHRFDKYFECPHGCGAHYHTYSFTHREFQCKDCNQTFLVPEHIKLNKPKPFKKKKPVKREASNA